MYYENNKTRYDILELNKGNIYRGSLKDINRDFIKRCNDTIIIEDTNSIYEVDTVFLKD
ncbi:MAG: hypothetical protein K6G26_07880 [Lachnospiraceae bacterium]|nr:hypothetical protein [Lachnospiraceae bacterium]